MHHYLYLFFFFFNDTATTEIYTLSLHDALPISGPPEAVVEAQRLVVDLVLEVGVEVGGAQRPAIAVPAGAQLEVGAGLGLQVGVAGHVAAARAVGIHAGAGPAHAGQAAAAVAPGLRGGAGRVFLQVGRTEAARDAAAHRPLRGRVVHQIGARAQIGRASCRERV